MKIYKRIEKRFYQMLSIKNIFVTLLIAFSMLSMSNSVFAEAAKSKKPEVVIEETLAKLQTALDAIPNNNAQEVTALTKEATDSARELSANYKVEFERDRAIVKLKSATKHAKESALSETEKELKEVIKVFNDLKGLI